MALKFSYPENHGVTHADAYLKIDEILLGSADARVVYSVFHNTTARSKADASNQKLSLLTASLFIEGSSFTTYLAETVLDDADKTPAKQVYTYLKTLSNVPETGMDLTSATDV